MAVGSIPTNCIFCSRSWSDLKVYTLTWITNPKNSILILIPPSEVQETQSLKSILSQPAQSITYIYIYT